MLIMSTLARQTGRPLMLFNITWSTPSGKQKATLVALVLGVLDELNCWHPTPESEDTMGRMNDVLPAGWPYTVSVHQLHTDARSSLNDALAKTPKKCGLILCTSSVQDYKAMYAALNVQDSRLIS